MKKRLVILIGAVLLLAPIVLMHESAESRVANRIHKEYRKIEAPVLVPGGGLPEVERFTAGLRGIDLTGAPIQVKRAMTRRFVETAEENLQVRRAGGDTNAANDKVAFAKREFLKEVGRWRGQPF